MDYFGQPNLNHDIVVSSGFRFIHQTYNLIIQKPGEDDCGSCKIVISYETDLTNIKSRFTTLESGFGGGSTNITIEDIKTINPYLGIDEYYYDGQPMREKNEKFFQYYRTVDENNNLSGFGVKVQNYNNTYKGNLIVIDKKNNSIHLGYDESEYTSYTTNFETSISLHGFIQIYNTTGLKICSRRNNGRSYLRYNDGGGEVVDGL
jgi:hypothetical protein